MENPEYSNGEELGKAMHLDSVSVLVWGRELFWLAVVFIQELAQVLQES